MRSNTVNFLLISASLALLAATGCQPTNDLRYIPIKASYQVVLKQPLTIPSGSTRVFLQKGKVAGGHINEHATHCEFEVRYIKETDQTIQPEVFTVHKVQMMREEIVQKKQPIRYASLAAFRLTDSNDSGDSLPDIFEGYYFWFNSDSQPDVRRMTCAGALDEPWKVMPPSLAEINADLGDIASLELMP